MKKHVAQREHSRVMGGSGEYSRLKGDLLALNMFFEAARAGELGRSLAVLVEGMKGIVTGLPENEQGEVIQKQGSLIPTLICHSEKD